MNALDFAGTRHPTVHFGVKSSAEIVAKLREIADRIERNQAPRIVLQDAYSGTEVNHEDFTLTTLVLQFAEISPEAKPGTKLFGNDCLAPVEVK